MKLRLLLFLLPILILGACSDNRNSYDIGTGKWYFDKPETYVDREDQFEGLLAESRTTYDDLGYNIDPDQTVILAISESQESNSNTLLASTKDPAYIEQRGLDVYSKKVKINIDNVNSRRGAIFESSIKELEINDVPFFVIDHVFEDSFGNFLGGTVYYAGVVFKRELDIRITYNNKHDHELLTKAVEESEFSW